MKPITFVVQRRRNNEFYKCDSTTRLRVTSYALRVAAALLADTNPSDPASHFHDIESVRSLLLAQRGRMDWTGFDVESFFALTWTRGRRRRVPIELVKDGSRRYDDVRHLRVDQIEHFAAKSAGVDPSVLSKILAWGQEGSELTQEAILAGPAPSQRRIDKASEIEILTDLVADLSERIIALEDRREAPTELRPDRIDQARSRLVGIRRAPTH